MIQSALLVLAQDSLVERQIASLFCGRAIPRARPTFLGKLRRSLDCGC